MSAELNACPLPRSADELSDIATSWLRRFEDLINQRDAERIGEVFLPQGSWRDLLALTSDFQSFVGAEAIRDLLERRTAYVEQVKLRLSDRMTPRLIESVGGNWLEAVFEFDTVVGHAWGFIRLMPVDSSTWLAWTASTELDELHQQRASRTTWADVENKTWTKASVGRENWSDRRCRLPG